MSGAAPLPVLMCPRCRRPPNGWPIIHDGLRCSNAACGRRYSSLPGTDIPVVVAQGVDAVMDHDAVVNFTDVDAVGEWLDTLTPGNAEWERALRTGMYAVSHHQGEPVAARLYERFVARLTTLPKQVVELGCGVGGFSNLVATRSESDVVAIDSSGLALRMADAFRRGGSVAVPVLRDGVALVARELSVATPPPAGRVTWLCADALDPPLMPASFDLVVALNLFDSTPEPTVALGQAAALVAPGGHLLMAQPDAWNTQATPADRWLPSTDHVWDSLLAAYGLETIDAEDGFVWRMERTPRYRFEYVSHARLALRPA